MIGSNPSKLELARSLGADYLIDRVFPLVEVEAAQERLESSEQMGKLVSAII